jgi:hypothetical protein
MESNSSTVESEQKLPKNCKENRYYYKNREAILEKKRLARLAKKGDSITSTDDSIEKLSIEERRKKKMEFLGVLEPKK